MYNMYIIVYTYIILYIHILIVIHTAFFAWYIWPCWFCSHFTNHWSSWFSSKFDEFHANVGMKLPRGPQVKGWWYDLVLAEKRWGGNHLILDCRLRLQHLMPPKSEVAPYEKLEIHVLAESASQHHLEAGFNLWGHGSGILVLACLNGHKTAIPNTSTDALFQEVSKAIELGCCASTEVACLTCCGEYVTNFVMEPVTCPKANMACLVDATEAMSQAQECARALHCLLLVIRKRGSNHYT